MHVKNVTLTTLPAMAAFFLVAAAATAFADITWRQTDTVVSADGTRTMLQTIYVTPQRFAIDNSDGLRLIIDLGGDTVTTLDTGKKKYLVSSLSALRRMRDDMKRETRRLIDEAVSRLPGDQRDRYREELKKRMGGGSSEESGLVHGDFQATGETGKLLGHDAKEYRAEADDGTIFLVWCATDMDSAELRRFTENARKTGMLDAVGPQFSSLGLGFPLRPVTITGEMRVESVVTDISHGTIGDGIFIVPAGYTEITPDSAATEKK
ncbi:MAG: hypothetical protein J7M24_03270 [Candidatus Latescibacteria bacterium]|nr:hypothetical protein [Candidatus Latescibacterota bacterium]